MNSQKTCRFCNEEFFKRLDVLFHEDVCDKNPLRISSQSRKRDKLDRFELSANSFGGTVREYKLNITEESSTDWLVDLHDAITNDTHDLLINIRNYEGELFKWHLSLDLTFKKLDNPYIIGDPLVYFTTRSSLLYFADVLDCLQYQMKNLVDQIEKYEENGSGWRVHQLTNLTVSVVEVDDMTLNTKRAGPQHIHQCPENMTCHFPPHSSPSFGTWNLPWVSQAKTDNHVCWRDCIDANGLWKCSNR